MRRYLARGLAAGLAGGVAYAGFVALALGRLIALAESHELRGTAPAAPAPPAIPGALGGLLWGALLGLGLGLAFYFTEPALPGAPDTVSYLLGAAGFLTVSGVPWLVLPPRPPGVEPALPTGTRLALYAGLMAVGAVSCGLAGYAYVRLRDRGRAVGLAGAAVALVALPAAAVALAPANPATGPTPPALDAGFRWTVVFGQAGLWFAVAAAHAWLVRRV